MPVFASIQPPGLYPGDNYALVNNAASDTIVHLTQQVVICQTTEIAGNQLTLTNTTNQAASVYVAAADAPTATYPNGQTGNYKALTDADSNTAVTVASGSTITFTTPGPFICGYFATAPSSGSLIIAR
jgi:hypothetical protein